MISFAELAAHYEIDLNDIISIFFYDKNHEFKCSMEGFHLTTPGKIFIDIDENPFIEINLKDYWIDAHWPYEYRVCRYTENKNKT